MSNIFFVSDQHFGHENILKFKCLDRVTPIRPEFSSVEEMDETMIERHNKVVGPNDDVYFGGDVAFSSKVFNAIMPRLNGKKRLILGNHDQLRMDEYYKYFKRIVVSRRFNAADHRLKEVFRPDDVPFLLIHYPIHKDSEHPNYLNIVHGHIHEKQIMLNGKPDRRFFNISVERNNYTPVSIEQILEYFRG